MYTLQCRVVAGSIFVIVTIIKKCIGFYSATAATPTHAPYPPTTAVVAPAHAPYLPTTAAVAPAHAPYPPTTAAVAPAHALYQRWH
jgi:hypothetical protein